MLGKTTRGRKRLQMLGDITSKDYITLKRYVEDRNSWQKRVCHTPAIRQKTKERLQTTGADIKPTT